MNANQSASRSTGADAKSETEVWTIGRLLSWTAEYLAKSGAENPRLDAEVLLAHARGCPRIELYTAFTEPATDALRDAFRALVKQRAAGMPVAYLVGRREFYSLAFEVTRDVLIPRPETEFVVVEALDCLEKMQPRSEDSPARIADVGTGSGAIAVALAVHSPRSRITAIDVSSAALAVASRNVEQHRVGDRVELLEGDLFSNVDANRQFDVIVSNPPYVSESELVQVSRDVREFEPRLALVSGPTGTEIIERLVAQAAERLVSGGWLIFEMSPMIEGRVRALLADRPEFDAPSIRKDLAGLPRVVIVRRK